MEIDNNDFGAIGLVSTVNLKVGMATANSTNSDSSVFSLMVIGRLHTSYFGSSSQQLDSNYLVHGLKGPTIDTTADAAESGSNSFI